MDDMGILTRDFGFGPGGGKPISAKFSDVFGEPAKFTPNTNYGSNYEYSSMRDFEYDYVLNEDVNGVTGGSSKTSSAPVYDKPVYDDADADIFDGLPGLKSKSAGNYDNDFDDLLGNSRLREKATENIISSSSSKSFDHLLAGSGRGISTASNRFHGWSKGCSFGKLLLNGLHVHLVLSVSQIKPKGLVATMTQATVVQTIACLHWDYIDL